jgi:hypothetical protein
MKLFRYLIIAIGLALMVFNITKLDFNHLLEGESQVALIGIAAAACAILLMLILITSQKVKNKQKNIKD